MKNKTNRTKTRNRKRKRENVVFSLLSVTSREQKEIKEEEEKVRENRERKGFDSKRVKEGLCYDGANLNKELEEESITLPNSNIHLLCSFFF